MHRDCSFEYPQHMFGLKNKNLVSRPSILPHNALRRDCNGLNWMNRGSLLRGRGRSIVSSIGRENDNADQTV